jgi:hypothetical protein
MVPGELSKLTVDQVAARGDKVRVTCLDCGRSKEFLAAKLCPAMPARSLALCGCLLDRRWLAADPKGLRLLAGRRERHSKALRSAAVRRPARNV